MAGGTWSPTDKPVRPGFYMNFVAAALAAIQPGARGILAMPVKANWGPAKEIVEITSEKDLIDIYGTDTSGEFTAYSAIRLALLGGSKTILAYRLIDSAAAKASITLKDTAATPANVLTLTTKYETALPFSVTVRDNVVDASKQDIVLYQGTKQLYTFTFAKGTGIVDKAVAAINNDTNNKWITAAKVAAGNDTIAAVANVAFTGGNAGTAGVVNQDYVDAMAAFEGRVFDAFTLDGAIDPSLQTSVAAWIQRLRTEGKGVIAYMGGSSADDLNIATGNARSTGFNHEGIVNVGVSGILDGVTYPSAMVACWVAGKACGQDLSESLTYAVAPFDDVVPRLTNNQIISAINAGTLVLVHDGEKVKVEKGINTLTSLREGQNNAWKKIKCIRIMDAINTDTTKTANDSYIGKVLNNDDGRAALLSAIKKYFETIAGELIDTDFVVDMDKDRQANAEGDEFYWYWDARVIDSMERIYGTGYIRY